MGTRASIRIAADRWLGSLRRIWASIGYDEINWSYTRRGKALYATLRELAEVPYRVRNHNALTSGNGLSEPARGSSNVYQERPDGSPVYDFAILDRLYDTITGAGFRPIVELGFMPHDLVPVPVNVAGWRRDVGGETYESDGLWKHPPKDYRRWSELVHAVVRHCVERYGARAVEHWAFEVWNEPNIPNYWRGSFDDYCRLYDHAVAGATAALPSVRIGGPATTGPGDPSAREYLRRFLAHCVEGRNHVTGETGTRLDFVSFHTKGAHYSRRRVYNRQSPVERESPSSASMLHDIRAGLETLRDFPGLGACPVLVDECDPAVGTIYGVHDNPNFVVTNSEYYPTFLCALVRRILDLDAAFGDRIASITTWAFYMEGKRFFEGNRTLVTSENVEKPILNGLRMLARLGDTRLAVEASHRRDVLAAGAGDTEVDGLAARAGERLTVLVWHQADFWWAEGEADVEVTVTGVPFAGPARVRHWRIDGDHSNAYGRWLQLGRPEDPSPSQVAWLESRQGLELLEPPGSSRPRMARSCSASRSPSTPPRCSRSSRLAPPPPNPERAD